MRVIQQRREHQLSVKRARDPNSHSSDPLHAAISFASQFLSENVRIDSFGQHDRARPTDNWDFTVAASYIKGRFDDDALFPCNDFDGDGEADAEGTPAITGSGNVSYCQYDRTTETPDFNLTANSELRFPMGSVEPFIRGVFVYRPSIFSERVQFDYNNREQLNLFVGVRDRDGAWELNAFARNLLNQHRITNISSTEATAGTEGADFLSGYRIINTTNPREFGLTGTYRF